MWEIVKRYSRGPLASRTLWRSLNDGGKTVYTMTADHVPTGCPYKPSANPNYCFTGRAECLRREREWARNRMLIHTIRFGDAEED